LSFTAFLLFVGTYVMALNPTLFKVLRSHMDANPRHAWFPPIGLWLASLIYGALTGAFTVYLVALGFAYCFIPFLMVRFLASRNTAFGIWDAVAILLLWLPIELGLLPRLPLPPVRGVLDVYNVTGFLLVIYLYLVLRNLTDVGLNFRLKDSDWRTVIQNFIFFVPAALIIGFATGFIALSDRQGSAMQMIASLFGIAFFIALPEEILFRGVIHNQIEKRLAGKKNGVLIALTLSSLIFGLAHVNNHKPPYAEINLGPLGPWQFPWVYVLLATLAGYFYGWTYIKTRKVTAAALLHLLVNWVWRTFFSG
jgi:membrane protease YdiL (CAAX protease family)